MASSDLSVLKDMGFDAQRAEIAVKKTGGLQGALQWLEDNQDKTIEEITANAPSAESEETDPAIEPEALKDGEVARSMVCNICQKKFRSMAQAEFHASKTEHVDFSESTEEIAPLTEEEKKQKLEELRAKASERKAKQSIADKEEQKKNEKIRMKSTREIQDVKEELAKQEQIKAASAKRAEKAADIAAKKRIQEKIAADKETRRLKAETLKAEREGRAAPAAPAFEHPVAPTEKKVNTHTEARLRLQLATGGTVMKTFGADTTLFEVAEAVKGENGGSVGSFTMNFPRKTFEGSVDFGKTVKEAGLVPSAVLIVK
ncbi:UBX domain-containing protein [Lachnellula hyalina]|uniref:UBX domain-containing protein n=1 Tax=Lachnellula hyalina TaxID=1316788 RepID=A0A8H8TTT4_9HELO|nr:UBX domain-containing protein [Lachnellula hyalina]TVY22119.1 UBX domain-containing protein [Lachnellula hyalina]